jgi:hypothetical protein
VRLVGSRLRYGRVRPRELEGRLDSAGSSKASNVTSHLFPPRHWAAGIDVLPEADELDVEMSQLVPNVEEVTNRAGDTIEGCDQHDIELAAPSIGHELVQIRPLGSRTSKAVGVLPDDLETALRGKPAQVIKLGFWMLIEGRDTKIRRRLLQQSAARAGARCACPAQLYRMTALSLPMVSFQARGFINGLDQ